MTDQEIEAMISCDEPDPGDEVFRQWAERAGASVDRVRAIYSSVCDKRRRRAAGEGEVDPMGDF